jgi:hypothetical protein
MVSIKDAELMTDKVVRYWAGFFDGAGNLSDAALENQSIVAGLRDLCRKSVDADQKQIFCNALKNQVLDRVLRGEDVFLDVDYHPCDVLRQSITLAGIPEDNMPWKTWTQIDVKTGEVTAKNGYGANVVILDW